MRQVLPSQMIRQLVQEGRLTGSPPPTEAQIQPASLDLRLGGEIIRLRASFLPRLEGWAGLIEQLALYRHALTDAEGWVLEPDCVYLIPLHEHLDLPGDISGRCNARSSVGRIDLFARVLSEQGEEYDRIPAGYRGRLWLEVTPRTWPVRVRAGSCLAQLRLHRGSSAPALEDTLPEGGPVRQPVSVDLSGWPGPGAVPMVAWRARKYGAVIDVDAEGSHEVDGFWEPVGASGGGLILDPDRFYLLVTREEIQVPDGQAAELVAWDPDLGEFRLHYAGFFDPGFGRVDGQGRGSRAVLEVRCHDVPFLITHGQKMGHLCFESLICPPDKQYGARIGSHYQGQHLALSRQFRPVPVTVRES